MSQFRRRELLKGAAAGGIAAQLSSCQSLPETLPRSSTDEVRVAVVGLNGRGNGHASELRRLPNVKLVALCDVDEKILAKRGHGDTEAVEGPYNWNMLVGDVVALWDELNIEKSHFVGLSMGGMTAFGLAQDHADRLIGTVATNTRADAPQEFVEGWTGRIATAQDIGMEAMAAPTVERWCSDAFLSSGSPDLEKLKAMVASTSVTGYVGCGHALKELDFGRRLGEIDTPMLGILILR